MKTNHTSIELEWDGIVARNNNNKHSDKWTGEQKCLAFMHFTSQNWFFAWEFSKGAIYLPVVGSIFLSHRAPARISDLSVKYPSLIETRTLGKQTAYRIRYENIENALDSVPEELHFFIKKILSY